MTEEQVKRIGDMIHAGRINAQATMRKVQVEAKTPQELQDHLFILKVTATHIMASVGYNLLVQKNKPLSEFFEETKKAILCEADWLSEQQAVFKQAGEL